MEINNPHDKFFKDSLSRKEVAIDFMDNYLPQDLLNLIDLDNIIIEKDSFIEKELEDFYSDILYKVDLAEKEGYLYFLFEHKSYEYSKISLQLLKYMIKIWELKLKQKENDKLPLIVPMVVYHNKKEWDVGLKLSDMMVDIPKEIENYFPDYKYILQDLSDYSHEEIQGISILKVFLDILTSVNREDFKERFIEALEVLEKLRKQNKGIEYFETMIRYILAAKENMDVEDLKKLSNKISSKRGEEIMTIAEKLKQEGIEEGIEKGKRKRDIEIAKKMLSKGIDIPDIIEITDLDKNKIEEIKMNIEH